ncbi:MAG: hypothetical protein DWP92_00360 [Armatimonadetes bacterium]|nr:MAG: hypothetical protein DWP92_00360 [Armatimonadota bacterium]
MSDPKDPYNGDPFDNPPGWTDPYADIPPLPPPSGFPPTDPQQPPSGQPPGSPLLTGLILGLLLVAISVAVFQLFGSDDNGTAVGTTTTTTTAGGDTTTTVPDTDTTTTSSTTIPSTDPYPAVDPPIPAEDLKMRTDGLGVMDNDIKDIVFGTEADVAIGRLVASFGEPVDTGWQTSTDQWGVCAGDLERILTFETFAAIVTKSGGQEVFNGYRNDINFGLIEEPPAAIETLSGLKIGDTVADLNSIYESQVVTFGSDPKLGSTYTVTSAASGTVLLWGPVQGQDDSDRIIGIYAPDVCAR